MSAHKPVADFPTRISSFKHCPDGIGIDGGRMCGFFPIHHDELVMEPVIGDRFSCDGLADGNGILVVGKDQINPARVYIVKKSKN